MKATTAYDLWSKLHEYVRHYDATGQASLFAEDGIWELPFAPEGIPVRIEGRNNILAVSKAGMDRSRKSGRRILEYTDTVIHEFADPQKIIVEFKLKGETAEGQHYTIPYIQLLKTQRNKITLLRDYFPADVLRQALK